MSTILNEVLKANEIYSKDFGEKENLAIPPSKRVAVLTCMDARLDPAKFAGFSEGEAHIIRNAGGRASDDAIRSLVISHKLLGTTEWFVIHHSDCGMETFTNNVMSDLLKNSLDTAVIGKNGWENVSNGKGSDEGEFINWLTISNQKESVIEDVNRIKNHPLVSDKINIHGYIFNVKNGKLIEVV